MTPDLSFYLSHVKIDLVCPLPDVLRGLRAIWSSASKAFLTTARFVVIEIEPESPHNILCDGRVIDDIEDSVQLLPKIEAAIYHLLLEWHQSLTVLHGALIQHDGFTFLLTGPSDSGKSSLALQALRMGWTYCTDELTITDGQRIWGIRRAIQFDPITTDDVLPDFLSDTDTESYRWLHPEVGLLCQPLVAPVNTDTCQPPALKDVTTVILDSDADPGLNRLDGIDTLKKLHEACFSSPQHDLGALAGCGWTLNWADPDLAISQLQELCDRGFAA